jgi:hypothetical protein
MLSFSFCWLPAYACWWVAKSWSRLTARQYVRLRRSFVSSFFLSMYSIFIEDFRPGRVFIFDEALGKDCFEQGRQILRLYETDIHS